MTTATRKAQAMIGHEIYHSPPRGNRRETMNSFQDFGTGNSKLWFRLGSRLGKPFGVYCVSDLAQRNAQTLRSGQWYERSFFQPSTFVVRLLTCPALYQMFLFALDLYILL